mgnify:CR=1 FL=1
MRIVGVCACYRRFVVGADGLSLLSRVVVCFLGVEIAASEHCKRYLMI